MVCINKFFLIAIAVESFQQVFSNPEGLSFYVAIMYQGSFWCPGALINRSWIITSQKCGSKLKIDSSTKAVTRDQSRQIYLKHNSAAGIEDDPFLLRVIEPFDITNITSLIDLAPRRVPDYDLVAVIGYKDLNKTLVDIFVNKAISSQQENSESTTDYRNFAMAVVGYRPLVMKPVITGRNCRVSLQNSFYESFQRLNF